MAVIMISHNLGLAASFADEVMVMYAGRAVEQALTRELFSNVRMPYTRTLLDAIPRLEHRSHTAFDVPGGAAAEVSSLPVGCSFAPRCPKAQDKCRESTPLLEGPDLSHRWACWYPYGTNGGAA